MDAAFTTAKYPAYTTADLEAFIEAGAHGAEAMRAEINRRERAKNGDRSVMTPGEKLRYRA